MTMPSIQSNRLSLIVTLTAACWGCAEESVSIGDENETAYTGAELSHYAAEWDGYAEAFDFEPSSDRIRLTLDENGEGTLEFGDENPLPPPTDPDVGYPPGYDGSPGARTRTLIPGFRYSVQGVGVIDSRIELGILPDELYSDWCSLQTPILDEVNSTPSEPVYHCAHNWGITPIDNQCSQTNPQTGEQVPIDCGKFDLCFGLGPCSCTQDGCATDLSHDPDGFPVELDAALEKSGKALVGTLVVGSARVTVRMERK